MMIKEHAAEAASTKGRWPRPKVHLAAMAAVVGVAAVLAVTASGPTAAAARSTHAKPTIVLVHGAWANTQSWSGVIARLQSDGYTVDAPPNPLRSLKGDAAFVADYLRTIRGPIVLVAHSYGGAVITNAATGNGNVKALVYVDAFVPNKGESALALDSQRPGSALDAPPAKVLNLVPFPGAGKGDAEVYIKPGVFVRAFANDLPAKEGAVLAATQEPAVLSALTAKSGTPAWKTIPSWYVIGTIDRAIPPAEQLFMARRANSHVTEIKAGHLSMVSHPAAVTRVILDAARSGE